MKTMLVIRGLMTVVVVAIGVTRIASGQLVLGGLLCALAGLNVAMIVTMTRRRAELHARFPGLANRRGAARTGTTTGTATGTGERFPRLAARRAAAGATRTGDPAAEG